MKVVRFIGFWQTIWNLLNSKEKSLILSWLLLQISMVSLDLLAILLVGISVSAFIPIIQSKQSMLPEIIRNLYLTFGAKLSLYEFIFALIVFAGFILLLRTYLTNKVDIFFWQRIDLITNRFLRKLLLSHFYSPIERRMDLSNIQLIRTLHDSLISMTIYAIGNSVLVLAEIVALIIVLIALFLWQPLIALTVITLFGFSSLIILRFHIMKSRKLLKQYSMKNTKSLGELYELSELAQEMQLRNFFIKRVEAYTLERGNLSSTIVFRQIQFGFPRLVLEASIIIGGISSGLLVWYFLNITQGLVVLASLLIVGLRMQPALIKIQNGLQILIQHKEGAVEVLEMIEFYSDKSIDISCAPLSADMFSTELKIEGLCYSFETDTELFHELNLRFQGFGIHNLRGKNGVGKSTLIEIILGLRQPHKGKIFINDVEISSHKPECIGRIISYMSQKSWFIRGSLTDNFMGASLDEQQKRAYNEKVILTLRKLYFDEEKLQSTADAPWSSILSEGEKQKIAIARTLALNTPIIILDEPSASLDLQSKLKLTDLLFEESQNRMIIIVSHDELFSTITKSFWEL